MKLSFTVYFNRKEFMTDKINLLKIYNVLKVSSLEEIIKQFVELKTIYNGHQTEVFSTILFLSSQVQIKIFQNFNFNVLLSFINFLRLKKILKTKRSQ